MTFHYFLTAASQNQDIAMNVICVIQFGGVGTQVHNSQQQTFIVSSYVTYRGHH
jgi:hypothetical protein